MLDAKRLKPRSFKRRRLTGPVNYRDFRETGSWTAKHFLFLRIQVRASSQTRLKTESETGERRLKRLTLTPRFTDFFTDFEKKPTVLQSSSQQPFVGRSFA